MQPENQWTDLQKEFILENYDEQPRITYLKDNILKVNSATFKVGNEKDDSKLMMSMVGICDKKIRQERGMIFQDKSFVGHGTYLLYSTQVNSFIFSHWDLESNYQEGGFNFRSGDTITIFFNKDDQTVTISDMNDEKRKVILKIEHHNLEDLHICAVIANGKLTFNL